MSSQPWFITGTDTDVGKSLICAALMHRLAQAGQKVIGYKPVAAGCIQTADGLRNEDALLLQHFCSLPLAYGDVNPVAFNAPVAPHLAAARSGMPLSLPRLSQGLDKLARLGADRLLVEGAGGWRLPLGQGQYLSDLPREKHMGVILVVGMKLGCLNHALLTQQAILADGLNLIGWVANHIDPDMALQPDNLDYLTHALDAPCLGSVPFINEDNLIQRAQRASAYLTLPDADLLRP